MGIRCARAGTRKHTTSAAGLTLVIDLFFTVVFLAVMFVYSPLLTWIVLGAFPFYYLWVLGGGIIIVDDGMDHLSTGEDAQELAACRSCGSSAVCCGRRRGYP